jgi:pimeloyl-ACP methyl ester carboxylesterase
LEASLKTPNLRKLVLYEPPIRTDVTKNSSADAIDRMNSYLHIGEREKALFIFLQEIVGIQRDEMNKLQSLPSWSSRVASAHTIPREEASVSSYTLHPERFSKLETPTLLLLGGDSPSFFRAAIEILGRSISKSRIAMMPEQKHAAMDTAPELFLKEIIGFLQQ